jgi:hypothetical protein
MLLFTWVSSAALAGSLSIGAGTVVVVTDVASTDSLSRDRATLLGEVCAVGATALSSSGDGWWKGPLTCANGQTYAATAVAVTVPGTAPQPRSVSATTIAQALGKVIRFDGVAAPAAAAAPPPSIVPPSVAPGDSLRRSVKAGEAVRIVGLSPEDAYYPDRGLIIGKACYPTDDMTQNADGWHGGPMHCWDGENYYFFKVALASDPTHSSQDLSGARAEGERPSLFGTYPGLPDVPGTLADGTAVVIRDVSSEDAVFGDRADFVGKECKVTGDLHPQDDEGWFGGGLTCKKKYYYFYKVRVERK